MINNISTRWVIGGVSNRYYSLCIDQAFLFGDSYNNFFGHDEVIERMIDVIAQSDTSEMVVIAVASVKTPKVLKL